ncbi:MAG: group 1 truncated hemoglobin [Rhizobiales bacterium]|nr:group 1 truncated hemoglobin [Hyphomicrobiales bacterium]
MMTKMKFVLLLAASLSFAGAARAGDTTLYDDLGGEAGLTRIVNDATDAFLADKRISATFDETNMDRFRVKLYEQFCELTGGPCKYTGHSMAEAHKGLHLRNVDFNALVEDLQDALDKSDIPFATQNRLLALLAPMQHEVVTR